MIAVEKEIEVTNTLQGEAIEMSIHQDAMAHIMSVLTDLYSDPQLAVIREYSTNALDAHVEAGVDRPIEVTLPSTLSPYLKIRDFGNGLDAEDIREIYSRYGASTKRNSNDVVGMLGLGCKSALTYTDQFTISGTKNGKTTQVSVSRDEKGAGTMTIVAEYEGVEENGVEIIIPVKKYNEFAEKANDFFRFWEEGKVLVNGEAPKRVDGLWLTDDLLLAEGLDSQDYIVMGNVAYPFSAGYNRNYSVVAFVEIGAVQFTPSREALQMTKHTEAKVAEVTARVQAERIAAAQRMIDDAPNQIEALTTMFRVKNMLGLSATMSYNGVEIPTSFDRADDAPKIVVADAIKRTGRKGWDKHNSLPTSWLSKVEFIIGYNGSDLSPSKRAKMSLWQANLKAADDTIVFPESYVMIDALTPDQFAWVNPTKVHSWATIEALKLPKVAKDGTVSGRPTGSYKGFGHDGRYDDALLAEDLDPSKGIFYYGSMHISGDVRNLLRHAKPDCAIILMGANRLTKFQRDFPTAQQVYTAARELADTWVKGITEQDKIEIYLSENRYEVNKLKALDETKIDDPALAAMISTAKNFQQSQTVKDYNYYDGYITDKSFKEYTSPVEKYILLTEVGGYGTLSEMTKQHITLYVNAAYEAEKGTV